MICPKCGAEISDTANRCSNCGLRVNIKCPECGTLNRFGMKFCKNCGFDFLIYCPVCGSTNIYIAKECRKCHSDLVKKEKPSVDNSKTEYEVVSSFSSGNPSYKPAEIFIEEKTEIKQPEDGGIPYVEDNIEKEEQYFKVENEISQENSTPVQNEVQENENNFELIEEAEEEPQTQIQESEQAPVNDITVKEEPAEADIDTVFQDDINEIIKDENITLKDEGINEQEDTDAANGEQGFPDEDNSLNICTDTVDKIITILSGSLNKHIIAVNGPEGSGKTAVLNKVSSELSQKGYVTLYGTCTPLVQITSFGFFQDALLRMMGFPPYTNSMESFTKEFKKSRFAKVFSSLSSSELNAFLNVFYPSQKDVFENILDNKTKMFSIMEKVIKSFLANNNLIIIIDNFELLDGASYDFIMHMLKKGYLRNNRIKILVAYGENKSIQSYFDLTPEEDKIFETILLKKLQKHELLQTVESSFMFSPEKVIDPIVLNELVNKADGNAVRLEQEIALLIDTGYITLEGNKIFVHEDRKPEIKPVSFEELIKLRLNSMTPVAKNILFMAAIMGYRFATAVLCQSAGLQPDKAVNVLGYLIREMYIKQVDNYTCEFKNLTLWKLIYQEAKEDLLYKENSEKLYQTLKQLILSSNLQKVISCTEALSKNESFIIWQNTANISAKLGDTNLYIIAQKQCLKILEEQDMDDSETIKAQIYEEIGKLLCEKSPGEAVTYLANVLDAEIRDKNIKKIIDISGYFIKSCYLSGNYFGVTEAVDTLIKQLEKIQSVSECDIALIKTRKLRALLNIGNSEQLINIANEEIIPEIDKHIDFEQDAQYKQLLINAWLNTKINLAKAYGIQGNNSISKVIHDIRIFIDKYKKNDDYYFVQTDILAAFAKTVTGDINASNDILNRISNSYKDRKMETNLLAEWNIINIINRVLTGQDADLKIDLFELAAFANNINEHFIKNIVKLILGYVLQQDGNEVKALEIYNEEITYFAKEKVAIGALLAWALIVNHSLETGDELKAMDTATKSLDIAKSPKINNYFFIIYFKRILSKLYMRQGDMEAAKMYIEEAIIIAKQFGLKYQMAELYIEYAMYTEELMKSKRIYSQINLNNTYELYNKAVQSAKELKISIIEDRAYKARAAFKTFCQLNSLEIKPN